MAERSNRLDLIQRAAKRMAAADAAIATLQPAHELADVSNLEAAPLPNQDVLMPRSSDRLASAGAAAVEDNPKASPARVAEAPKGVRLKYTEMRRRGMIMPDNLRSNISFEYRAIKRKLLAAARSQGSNALSNNLMMVTSALPGEGKTYTAANLAFALAAERDLHVLLIDADVIRPSVQTFFDQPSGPGLTDLLNGKCSNVGQVIHRCEDIHNLSVIFAGARDEHTPELISSQRTIGLLTEMSRRYNDRIIIFDTPPVLASAEAATLAAYMHQAILVVAWAEPNRDQIQRALDNVSACRNVNLIFNKAPKWQKGHSDYYYYYTDEKNASQP